MSFLSTTIWSGCFSSTGSFRRKSRFPEKCFRDMSPMRCFQIIPDEAVGAVYDRARLPKKRSVMKKVLRSVFVFLLIVLVSVYPLLADDLTGKVLDPDGRAVPNASVRLYERNSGGVRVARASSDGMYSFKGIPGGEYLLEGDASDSALNGSKQVSVSGNQSENLDLKVSSRSTEISVIANSTPLSVQATGKAVGVIDARELAL